MASTAVRVRLLGPVDVLVGEVAREVRGLRRKATLATLALARGQVVSTDRLISAVWSDGAPATVLNTLQSNVSHLRHVLGDRSAIVARSPGYLLDTGGEPTDVETAERLVGQGTPGDLRAALALWRGPSLVDVCELPRLETQARRLDQLRLRAQRALVDARLAAGDHERLVPELLRLATEHPLDELLHGKLILALYRCGRQVEALDAYGRLRRVLRE